MDRSQGNVNFPDLTFEEKHILNQTRREALLYRVFPLMLTTNGLLYMRFRKTKTEPIVKMFSYGSMSILSFIFGVASYASEFRRRINNLEVSSLKEEFKRREGGQRSSWQNSQGQNQQGFSQSPGPSHWQNPSTGFNQAPTTGPFVGSQAPYSDFPTNDRRNLPGGRSDNIRFSSQSGGDSYFYNDRSVDHQNLSDSLSPHSDGYLNQDSAVSPYNHTNQEQNQFQPSTEASTAPEPQKYMSYKDRRLFYRNHPDAKGVIDPFGYTKSRNSQFNRDTRSQETPSYRNDDFSNPSQGMPPERPFIPFFDEGSSVRSDGKPNDRRNF